MNKIRVAGMAISISIDRISRAALCHVLLPALLLCAPFISGCVTTEEAASNKSSLAQLQVQVSSIDRDVNQMKEQMSSIVTIRESQSTILTQSNDFGKELQALRGRFDENKYFQDKSLKDMASELELQKARITALENQLKEMKGQQPTPQAQAKPADTAVEAPRNSDSAAKIYDEAALAVKDKKYSRARQLYERITKEYPKDSLAANAYFWIGETYYSEKKYEDAIGAYDDVIQKFPRSEKARSAMLKQGYAFAEMGGSKNRLAAKEILEALIEKHPKSKEAAAAQKKLKELAKSPSKSKKKN